MVYNGPYVMPGNINGDKTLTHTFIVCFQRLRDSSKDFDNK